MLEIVQAGQIGKTGLLFEMHRLRKRVFKDRLGWKVDIDCYGLEVDQFDIPEAVYLLSLDEKSRVIGNWRLLPSLGPTMIRDVWPEFLQSIEMPEDLRVWEASRYGVDSHLENLRENIQQVQQATQELFCGLTELCLLCGITNIFTMYDERIKRILKRIDCEPMMRSAPMRIDDKWAEVGAFRTDEEMLMRLRSATGLTASLINRSMLPPILQNLSELSTPIMLPSDQGFAIRPMEQHNAGTRI